MRPLALTETSHPTLAIVPYKPLCLNDILSYGSRFDTASIPDFNLDDFINVEMFTGEHDGFGGSDKDDLFDCGIHMDEEVVDFDVDVDISKSVQADPRARSECEKVISISLLMLMMILILLKRMLPHRIQQSPLKENMPLIPTLLLRRSVHRMQPVL